MSITFIDGVAEPEVEKVWREFWQPLIAPDGVLDLAQVKRELFDFGMVMDNVSVVYDHITGGRVSKPHTLASAVISMYEENLDRQIAYALEDLEEAQADG